MLKEINAKKKKVAPAPIIMKKQEAKMLEDLFEKRPKDLGIGQDILSGRDLTHIIKCSCTSDAAASIF